MEEKAWRREAFVFKWEVCLEFGGTGLALRNVCFWTRLLWRRLLSSDHSGGGNERLWYFESINQT